MVKETMRPESRVAGISLKKTYTQRSMRSSSMSSNRGAWRRSQRSPTLIAEPDCNYVWTNQKRIA